MEFDSKVENDIKTVAVATETAVANVQPGETTSAIYVDPELEASARRKFDKYLVPVSLIFIVLSALDRNNVSTVFTGEYYF